MTLNRSEIMTAAWTETRELMVRWSYAAHQLREVFAQCLRRAWATAKAAAALMARSAASIAREIEAMENTDRLGWQGMQRLRELHAAHHAAMDREAAEAEKKAVADMEEKRELIRSAKGRFVGVTFIKKDGSTRVMRVQPATLKFHIKGDAAAPSARQAVEARKARNPNLMPVWDVDKGAARSVNLSTITAIHVNGQTHAFGGAA